MIDCLETFRIEDFIMSLSKEIDNDILELKEYALKHDVPIIRDETRSMLIMLLNIKRPKNILEIGTAIGYSTIILAKNTIDANITTIEDYEKRIVEAKINLKKYNQHNTTNANINLIENDAGIFLEENKNSDEYDFIFLDAAKGQYINWLPHIKRLLKKDGILVSDNIFKNGEILESKYFIRKRDRTIHKRMRDFLFEINNDLDLNTYIYSVGDGLSVSIKK